MKNSVFRISPAIAGAGVLIAGFGVNALLASSAPAQSAPSCGCMDVVFVIDDTGSMGGAITNVRDGAVSIVADIVAASGDDQQLGVVTFKDDIQIDQQLQLDIGGAATAALLPGLVASGGGGPEASDEALNTVVNLLPAAGRLQDLDFTGVFRSSCVKIAIMATDNLPGGFDDTFTIGVDDVNADNVAHDALANGILISALHVGEASSPNPVERAIMENYATVTGGVYIPLLSSGAGAADAITEIIESCGASEIIVPLDIKAESCRNPIGLSKKGVLPVAILGTDTFDVSLIDPSTVMLTLDGLATGGPLRWSFEDVATPFQPFVGKVDAFDCTSDGADGFTDLSLKFDTQSVLADLGIDAADLGETLVLGVKGETFDGTAIRGEDVVVIVGGN